MNDFKHLNLFEIRNLAIEELVKYYCELRKYEYNCGKKLNFIDLRKKLHFIIILILKIDQILFF